MYAFISAISSIILACIALVSLSSLEKVQFCFAYDCGVEFGKQSHRRAKQFGGREETARMISEKKVFTKIFPLCTKV